MSTAHSKSPVQDGATAHAPTAIWPHSTKQGSMTLPNRGRAEKSKTAPWFSHTRDDLDIHSYEEIPDFMSKRQSCFTACPEERKWTTMLNSKIRPVSQLWLKNERSPKDRDTNEKQPVKTKSKWVQNTKSALLSALKTPSSTLSKTRSSIDIRQRDAKSPSHTINKADISFPVHVTHSGQTRTKDSVKSTTLISKDELRRQYKHRQPPQVPKKKEIIYLNVEGQTPTQGFSRLLPPEISVLRPRPVSQKDTEEVQSKHDNIVDLQIDNLEQESHKPHAPGHSSPKIKRHQSHFSVLHTESKQSTTAEVPSCAKSSDRFFIPSDQSDSEIYTPLIPMRRKKKNKTPPSESEYATLH